MRRDMMRIGARAALLGNGWRIVHIYGHPRHAPWGPMPVWQR